MPEYHLGELFCGPGGLSLGAAMASVETADVGYKFVHRWASDYDPDTCRTFARNIPDACEQSALCKDIRTFDPESVASIDCLAFGFPCNDYSAVGEQLGLDGKFGPLYVHGVRFLDHHKPKMFLAENVGGLARSDAGRTLDRILLELQGASDGYDIFPHCYKAEHYGVARTRHRILIAGFKRELGLTFRPPEPTTAGRAKTARQALEDPPILASATNQERTKQAQQVVERLSLIKPGENVFNAAELPDRLRLRVAGATISQIYRRLDPDKPSYTVTGSGGGGTHVSHWEENRALTNRERAGLQSFPDTYVFLGSKESARKQIGMAVPPLLAKAVFEAKLKTMAGMPYRSVSLNMEVPGVQRSVIMEKAVAYR